MMSLWDALRMNMMISYQELVRTFPNFNNRARLSLSFLCIAKIKKQETALNSDKYMLKALFIRNFRISIYRYLTFPTRYCINGKHPLDYHG